MAIRIRRAREADAESAINTIHRSITELCVADHQYIQERLEGWLDNKTVENWVKWVARDDAVVLVAVRERETVGVGMATFSGEILLNYVSPDERFGGVSKAIAAAIEVILRERGVPLCRLESTITARMFYENRGFRPEANYSPVLTKPLRSPAPVRGRT
jgi:GNAT superfamily N-acetyltransferase